MQMQCLTRNDRYQILAMPWRARMEKCPTEENPEHAAVSQLPLVSMVVATAYTAFQYRGIECDYTRHSGWSDDPYWQVGSLTSRIGSLVTTDKGLRGSSLSNSCSSVLCACWQIRVFHIGQLMVCRDWRLSHLLVLRSALHTRPSGFYTGLCFGISQLLTPPIYRAVVHAFLSLIASVTIELGSLPL